MNLCRTMVRSLIPLVTLGLSGCIVSNIDFSTIHRPPPAPELEAYNVFVGSWTWKAEMLHAADENKAWQGTAVWDWALDKRSLRGHMSAQSGDTRFEATGFWSWHPKKKKYIWWMFNNWGYPQKGTASYDPGAKCWRMDFVSVGLDGTTSYGRHRMTVVDDDTLDWSVVEWADPFHLIKKMEMTGTYTRQP